MIKNLPAIEAALGLPAGEFEKLYKDPAEKEIDITALSIVKTAEFEIIPKSDYTTRITNIKNEGIESGRKVMSEEVLKGLKKEFSLEIEGAKKLPLNEFAAKVREKILADANLPENPKVKELTTEVGQWKQKAETAERKVERITNEFKEKESVQKLHNWVSSDAPKEFILPTDKAIRLALEDAQEKEGIKPGFTADGIPCFKKGDEILKDDNLVPKKPSVVLQEYFKPYVKPATGGGGGSGGTGDNAGKQKSTLEAFNKEMADKGHAVGSAAYVLEMGKRMKENPGMFK